MPLLKLIVNDRLVPASAVSSDFYCTYFGISVWFKMKQFQSADILT